jgi:hypothetical protein
MPGSKRQPDPRTLSPYKRARANLAAQGLPCWICRNPIDYTLRWPNPWSFTADHALELDAGGDPNDPANLRPSHARCNIRRGNYYRQGRDTRRPPERDW